MEFGICSISIVPLRSEPSERAEMVSQILFGETFEITSRQDQWWQVRLSFDSYEGWINEKQGSIIEIDYYEKLNTSSQAHAYELVQSATNNDTHMPIVIGSTLPEFDGMNFKLNGEKFIYSGQAINPEEATITAELLVKSAMKFMNAPYLWGGRSPFGIDCSGYTQVVFKLLGIKLPRDAYQQADKGKMISFIDEAVEGDLAFFDNEDGNITHTGIIITHKNGDEQEARNYKKSIIHASGQVRMDFMDHYGIYNAKLQKYTHKLRIIKRIL